MQVYRGFHHAALQSPSAVSIGNFDGVHRGHQAMLATLVNEARHRGLCSTVLTFEPHPRDHFARVQGKPELAPRRIASLRDKLAELARCGVERAVVLRFDQRLAALDAEDFIRQVLVDGLRCRYVLVGDDFRFGAARRGDYALLDARGAELGFEAARMHAYELHGQRVSSSTLRQALDKADFALASSLLGRPYALSGHVLHGNKLGRELGFPTINLLLRHRRPAASGIFAVRVHGLSATPLNGVASLGVRPTVDDSGRVLLEVHLLDWSGDAYAKLVRVELLHKLRDEARYDDLESLRAAIAADVASARAWLQTHPADHRI